MGQGIKAGGGSENLKPELQAQDILISNIFETIVGKSSGATATEDTILEGYSAYVGQELVSGKYLPHPELFGYTKFAVDKFTRTTSEAANTVTLTHSLGEKPRFVFIYGNPTADGVAKYYLIRATGVCSPNDNSVPQFSYSYVYGSGGSFGNAATTTTASITTSTIVIPLQQVYQSNVEYTLITMA